MSRIGLSPIKIESGVTVKADTGSVVVTGPKGELKITLPSKTITVEQSDDQVMIKRKNDARQTRAYHGLVRSLVANMIAGVTKGYQKKLELVGTGYRVKKTGEGIELSLGFSHPVTFTPPKGITLETEGNNVIIIQGIDKQQVGQTAAEIRAKRKPEPYKGKGIRYAGEVVRRKAGKTAGVGTGA